MSDFGTTAEYYADHDLGGLLCDECMGDCVTDLGEVCPVCRGEGVTGHDIGDPS